MNFNQLLIFHKVAQLQHITRAAEALYISQPAVSKQVQELEKTSGQLLFTRVGRGVQLTEAGRLLYDYADRIFTLANEAETALNELQGLERGHLRIGATMTIGTYLLPSLLGQFRKRYPAIELSLDIANAEEIQAKVRANQLELGLVEGFVTDKELERQEWQRDEMVLIDGVFQPWIKEDNLTMEQVLGMGVPFILREPGSGTRAVFDKALFDQHLPSITAALELNSLEAIKRAVGAGLGVSLVSVHSISLEEELGLVRRVPLVGFELIRSLYLVSAPHKIFSKTTQAFLDLITD